MLILVCAISTGCMEDTNTQQERPSNQDSIKPGKSMNTPDTAGKVGFPKL
ncbi:MAG: hypothetical protein V4580_18110 [Bacteroidota bacterium]